MPTQTINQAIARIVSINPELKEEELSNLLIASGWDKNDISIGMNCYHALTREIVVSQEILPTIHTPLEILESNIDILPTKLDPVHTETYTINRADNSIDNSADNNNLLSPTDAVKENIATESPRFNKYLIINVLILIVLLIILAAYILKLNMGFISSR